jgi:general secretion pathway protein H
LASPIRAKRGLAPPIRAFQAGFTLIELIVVIAIVAITAGLISLSIRDPAENRLENEAARLVALLEGVRTEARVAGIAVTWVPSTDGHGPAFRFIGLPASMKPPDAWLDARVSAEVIGRTSLILGPEAILPPQRVVLKLEDRRLEIGSDGLAAFAVLPPSEEAAR